MRVIQDITLWAFLWIFFISGAARAMFDGAFLAYFRPQWEGLLEQLPEFIRWML